MLSKISIVVLALTVSANQQGTRDRPSGNYKPISGSSYGAQAPETQICDLLIGVNNFRARNGLSPLIGDVRLDQAARRQCNAMAEYNNLDHSADGSKLGDRIEQAGYNWGGVAENIYNESGYGGVDQQRALEGWINSSGHRENLLGDYTSIGHAYCETGNTVYWSQDFGSGDVDPQNSYSCNPSDYEYEASPEEEIEYVHSEREPSYEAEQVESEREPRYRNQEVE
ncbi:hypothetical protein HDU92_001552, partial [Lobulomyces angularis]